MAVTFVSVFVLLLSAAEARRVGALGRSAARMSASGGGQPGGRVGCCFKSASYLDNLGSVPVPPADREEAAGRFREAPGATSLAEVLAFCEEHTQYSPRIFRVGDVVSAAGERAAASRMLSLGKLLRMSRAEAEVMHAAAVEGAQPADREALDEFALTGWEGVHFPEGICLEWR